MVQGEAVALLSVNGAPPCAVRAVALSPDAVSFPISAADDLSVACPQQSFASPLTVVRRDPDQMEPVGIGDTTVARAVWTSGSAGPGGEQVALAARLRTTRA